MSDITDEEKGKQTYKIQTLYAHHLFYNKRFQEAMDLFLKLGTDPYEVIRLFPDLAPSTNTHEVSEPTSSLPKLQDHDLEKGLRALIVFLTEVRHKLMAKDKELSKEKNGVNGEKNSYVVATEQLLKIIDTTLLKCYLQVKEKRNNENMKKSREDYVCRMNIEWIFYFRPQTLWWHLYLD